MFPWVFVVDPTIEVDPTESVISCNAIYISVSPKKRR